MSRTAEPSLSRAPAHAVHVLDGGCAVACAQVRALAAGLSAHGLRVSVCAPRDVAAACVTGTGAGPVRIGGAGRTGGTRGETLCALRAVCADADVVHAHGPRAAALAALALAGAGGRARRVPLVLSWHAREHPDGARAAVLRMLERRAVRAASVVLGATGALVQCARRRGARDARLASAGLP
ncbi:glycosyltransferase, partial [Streptomyces sp. JJ36]|uniref:glycosyltransferase n=1 Tax=Streptomyces sp. JJ36 TaxID=2736645 RepID=UPI001F384C18